MWNTVDEEMLDMAFWIKSETWWLGGTWNLVLGFESVGRRCHGNEILAQGFSATETSHTKLPPGARR